MISLSATKAMAEVQAHGNIFEDIKIRELTGLGKKEYDKLKKNGYTSAMDIVKGLRSNVDISIKTTGSKQVDSSDITKKLQQKEYDLIVAQWKQITPKNKKISYRA